MSMKVLAGFAAALVVTTVGVFAAGGGDSLFNSDSGPSPCSSQKSSCPLSAAAKPACCAHDDAEASDDVCPSAEAKPAAAEVAK